MPIPGPRSARRQRQKSQVAASVASPQRLSTGCRTTAAKAIPSRSARKAIGMISTATVRSCRRLPPSIRREWSGEGAEQGTAERLRRAVGKPVADVVADSERGGSERRGEPDEDRDAAGHGAGRRPPGAREEEVLATGFWQAARQRAMAQRSAGGEQTADEPGEQHQPRRFQVSEQEAAGGEDARAGHARDHPRARREQAEAAATGRRGHRRRVSAAPVIGTKRTGRMRSRSSLPPCFLSRKRFWLPKSPTGMIMRPPSRS